MSVPCPDPTIKRRMRSQGVKTRRSCGLSVPFDESSIFICISFDECSF